MIKVFALALAILLNIAGSCQTSKQAGEEQKLISLRTGVSLEYVELGDPSGMPVVLLHGFTDSWHSFETVLPFLPPDLHVFVLTQRGHGNSEKPENGYEVSDMAMDVADFVRQKQTGPVVIAGHSMGGMVALQFVLDYPELAKGLIIIGSDASFADNPGIPEFSRAISQLTDPVPYAFADEFQRSTCAVLPDSTYYKSLVKETLKVPVRVWKAVMQGMVRTDLSDRLGSIRIPVLVLWGDKDGFCTLADQERLLKNILNARMAVYEGTGHAVHWEQPRRFTNDLTRFVHQQFHH